MGQYAAPRIYKWQKAPGTHPNAFCMQKKEEPEGSPLLCLLLLRQLFNAEHMPQDEPDKPSSVKYHNFHTVPVLPSETAFSNGG